MSRATALPIRLRLVGYADSTTATRLRRRRGQPQAGQADGKAGDPLDAVGHGAVGGHGDAELVAVVDHLLESERGPDDPAVELGDGDAQRHVERRQAGGAGGPRVGRPGGTTAWSTGTPSASSGEAQPSPRAAARASPDRTAPPAAHVVVTTTSASRNRSSAAGGASSGPVRSE